MKADQISHGLRSSLYFNLRRAIRERARKRYYKPEVGQAYERIIKDAEKLTAHDGKFKVALKKALADPNMEKEIKEFIEMYYDRRINRKEWSQPEREKRDILETGQAVVCNIKEEIRLLHWGKAMGLYVYIGRPSKWKNPYRIPDDGDRAEVCRKFEEYYFNSEELQRDIHELRGKLLGCFCFPEQCHGDFLISQTEKGA